MATRRMGLARAWFLVAVGVSGIAAASLNFAIDPAVVSGGGGGSTSASYDLEAAAGQTASGVASSPGFILAAGFFSMIGNGGGGTVLVSDGFSDLVGWTVVSGGWVAGSGILEHLPGALGRESIRSNGPLSANAWFEVKVTVPSGTPTVCLVFRAQDPSLDGNNQYWVELDYAAGQIRLRKDVAGVESDVATSPFGLAAGITYTLRVKAAGSEFRVLLDGTQRVCASDTSWAAAGAYGLQVSGGSVVFDDFTVVVASNSIPVANAGADQSLSGAQSVLLDGTGSADGDGDPLNYTWTQTGGAAVTLSNPTSAAPSFAGAEGNTYAFQLVVDDCLNPGVPDAVVIVLGVPVSPPPGGGGGGGKHCGLLGLEALLLLLIRVTLKPCT